METFRYNTTSAGHPQTEGRATTVHTFDLKQIKKLIKKIHLQILNIHYLQMSLGWEGGMVLMVRAAGPGFTHAVETCRVKGLYTAVPDVTKSYSHKLG